MVYHRLWSVRRLLSIGTLGVGGVLLSSTVTGSDWQILRMSRTFVTAAEIIADYKWSLWHLPPPDHEIQLPRVHFRSAERLRHLFEMNQGVYIKVGQHLGQLQHVLPEEYVEAMSGMMDRAPISSSKDVASVIEAELGRSPETIFESFDWTPIASASLAQVHRATTKEGQEVAVKVQHRSLQSRVSSDLRIMEALVNVAHRIFPTLDYRWLIEETKQNLPRELDFRMEADNARECQNNFRHRRDVVVPDIIDKYTSKRVLCMEFMSGVAISDVASIQELGVRPTDAASLVTSVFSEMIFKHGFVHCDPHQGNILVRRMPGSYRPQIVLLDHGLYRRLDADFLLSYCRLWRSLIFADLEAFKNELSFMNVDAKQAAVFAAILTTKPWEAGGKMLEIASDKSSQARARSYAYHHLKPISDVLSSVPRALLLLLKTNDCLRAVNARLGATCLDWAIMARDCVRCVQRLQMSSDSNQLTWLSLSSLRCWAERCELEMRICLFRCWQALRNLGNLSVL